MIRVSLTALIFFYILGLGGTILLFWLILEKVLAKPTSTVEMDKALITCDICLHVFVDSSGERYVKCPQCNALLDRERIPSASANTGS